MQTKERVIDVLSTRLNINKLLVKENSDIVVDLGADSLDMAEIIRGIEEEFGILLCDAELESVRTVGELAELIEKIRMCK